MTAGIRVSPYWTLGLSLPMKDVRNLNIWKNEQWNTRLEWFSDFKYTNIEWENTFTFTINKYLTSKLFLYPKFIDNNTKYRRENGSYWMFREWLSMGLSYSW